MEQCGQDEDATYHIPSYYAEHNDEDHLYPLLSSENDAPPPPVSNHMIMFGLKDRIWSNVLGGSSHHHSTCHHYYSSISQWHPYSKAIVWLAALTIISSMYCIHQYNKEYSSIMYTISKDALVNISEYRTLDVNYLDNTSSTSFNHSYLIADLYKKKFLVYNPYCYIPNLDPINEEVKPLIKKKSMLPCTKFDPLTYVQQFNNYSILYINQKLKHLYAPKNKLSCCYSIVKREKSKPSAKPDNSFVTTDCTTFKDQVVFNASVEFFIVKCKDTRRGRGTVYSNSHTVVLRKPNVVDRILKHSSAALNSSSNSDEPTPEPISVFMIGIDSISRLNLYRSMPKTAQYLKTHGWYELKGYNKMGENTFPNLMAIFTGFDKEQAYKICDPTLPNKLDKCPMVLYTFRDSGYATAYAEDEAIISTFNFHKVGFTKPPTDHYIRPLFIASQKALKAKKVDGLSYCLGSETSEDLILTYAQQFLTTYRDDPYFGFFWMNSFSHNNFNEPVLGDLRTRRWLETIATTGVYNKSIVIFFSDHGMRFGDIRTTNSGWLEDRLPMIHFWLPEWFKKKYPNAVESLKVNANRFTTPYDLHMTLQDILLMSKRIEKPIPSAGCPNCHTLFEEMHENRSCADANVSMHWCTCYGFRKTIRSEETKIAADYIVKEIKSILLNGDETRTKCVVPKLKQIVSARISEELPNNTVYYLLIIEVRPAGLFEGTVRHQIDPNTGHPTYDISDGGVSRIDKYGSQSHCIHNSYYKNYCYCKKNT